MPAPALPLVPPDAESPGVWPWIVAVLAAIALVVAVGERVSSIPHALEVAVVERLAAGSATAVSVDVDGRDVALGGELPSSVDRPALIRDIEGIDGVRVVVDDLVVVDPAARARADRERFREALASIDLAGVAFEPGLASIAAGSDDGLEAIAGLMREMPGYRVRVTGHTDSRGRAAVNLALSRERAAAVAADLAARGVDRTRVVAQGYGATQPVADNDTEAGRARNRRIEIVNID